MVKLSRVGPYWMSDIGLVWYDDAPHHRLWFNLPLTQHGIYLRAQAISQHAFSYGELNPYEIKPLTDELPRQLTPDEMTQMFMDHVRGMASYWETVDLVNTPGADTETPELRQRLEGLLFSILSTLGGSAADLPGFQLVPSTTKEDQEFDERLGNHWWPNHEVPDEVQLTWPLHEIFSAARRASSQSPE